MDTASGRLGHFADNFGGDRTDESQRTDAGQTPNVSESFEAHDGCVEPQVDQAETRLSVRRPALALTAEGPRRADLIAWAGAHRDALAGMRLLAPAGIKALLREHVGLEAEALKSGTIGPVATA